MKRNVIVPILVLFLVILSGCSSSNESLRSDEKSYETIEIMASSSAFPAIEKLSVFFNQDSLMWNKDNEPSDSGQHKVTVVDSKNELLETLIDGKKNFIAINRALTDSEKNQLGDFQEHRIGIQAIPIILNPQNEIFKVRDDLSIEEVRKLFSGEIKYWNELDARLPERKIKLIITDSQNGLRQVLESTLMKGTPITDAAIQFPFVDSVAAEVSRDVDAIGISSFGHFEKNKDKLSYIKIDGYAPTNENIISEKYKIASPLLLIKQGQSTELEQFFLEYTLLSTSAWKAIEEMGIVPIRG